MDKNYREIDGGVYDDLDADIHFVLLSIAEELKMYLDSNGAKGQINIESKLVPLDFDEVVMKEEESNRIGSAVYQSRTVMEFKAKTEQCFQPIEGMSATEIEELVEEYVTAKLADYDFDAEIRGVVISGSRCRGLEGKLSNRRLSQVISADYIRWKYLSQSAVNEVKAFYIGWHRRLSRAYFSSAMAGLK